MFNKEVDSVGPSFETSVKQVGNNSIRYVAAMKKQ